MRSSLWSRFTSHLYVRIWLAVVVAILVLTFAVGTAWQLTRAQPRLPIREIIIENDKGEIIGNALTRAGRLASEELVFDVVTNDGQKLNISLPRPSRPSRAAPWIRPPFGFGWMLAVVGLAVALGTYPIIRRLTMRLETLQRGVERWGAGDLSTRLDENGRDEVAFLARRFNHAAERIETLMDSHKALLANASHELRSPLARIRMSLELLNAPTLSASRDALPPKGAELAWGGPTLPSMAPTLSASRNALPPKGAELAWGGPTLRSPAVAVLAAQEEIKRSITELDQLIDEILLASRLDARQADAEPFELIDLTGLAAEECARTQAELVVLPAAIDTPRGAPGSAVTSPQQLVSQGNQGVIVSGSPRLLRRLLRNLLENARRYGTGQVTVELAERRSSGSERLAVIAVNDRGPGVPANQRERIFEPFYRLSGASERDGGVGLGLALVKSISLRHGGSVRCAERTGGGASFIVELPLADSPTV